MEIIQEIIGTRKKQQILNQEAKKNIHKQIKKVTHRDVSEPPPTTIKGGMLSNPSQILHGANNNRHDGQRDESIGPNNNANATTQSSGIHQQNTQSKRGNNSHRGDGTTSQEPSQPDSITKNSSAKIQAQMSSPKPTQQSSKKQSSNQPQQHQQVSSSAQKKLQDMRVRKVRSKSPPTNESGKNPAAKIKKFYDGMIPSFTNKKRQHAYYNTSKQGFTYINWDMENELYIFQTQIEQKFRKSAMNKNFNFPRIEMHQQRNRASFEDQQQLMSNVKTDKRAGSFIVGGTHQKMKTATSPEHPTQGSHSHTKQVQRHKSSQDPHNRVHSMDKPLHTHEGDLQNKAKAGQLVHSQTTNVGTGELSARIQHSSGALVPQHMHSKQTTSYHTHHTDSKVHQHKTSQSQSQIAKSAHKTPGPPANILSLKVQQSSHPMSKSELKPDKELISTSYDVGPSQSLNPGVPVNTMHYSHKKPDGGGKVRDKHHHTQSSANSIKLTQNQKQLTAMIKQTGVNPQSQQTAQSSLFSPTQTGVSRKNPKQALSTTYASVKGTSSQTSQKTYGLAQMIPGHLNQSSTVPTTPLPATQQTNHLVGTNYQSRDQSARSQRDLQQQQGQSEPLLKKATTYMQRKNGQQHSVHQRMPKAAPAYCTTQFNNSVNSSQMPSRLTVQTSVDAKDNMSSAKKTTNLGLGGASSELNMSQYTSTQRLNDSSQAIQNGSGNMIKFSSEYGTYNTVQIDNDMINRSSDYGGGRGDSIDRQSQKTNPMTISGIVSPDIQIQSTDCVHDQQQVIIQPFEPQRMLNGSAGHLIDSNSASTQGGIQLMGQPYGAGVGSAELQASKLVARSHQSSVQAMRGGHTTQGVVGRRSPSIKKRNIKGQHLSSQMNKTTSINEVKKIMQKSGANMTSTNSLKTKNFYKTMVKPGGISSQSFVQAPDHNQHNPRHLNNGDSKHARFNSHTPRTITSPEHHVSLQKLQKTSESKQESSAQQAVRLASAMMHQTPQSKMKQGTKAHRQQSLNSKEMFQVSKFKTDMNIGPAMNQYTPNTNKMAPSKPFTASDSKIMKDISPSGKQKNIRSRNNEPGKQTVDNGYKSTKWIEERQQNLTLKKVSDGKSTTVGHQSSNNQNFTNHSKRAAVNVGGSNGGAHQYSKQSQHRVNKAMTRGLGGAGGAGEIEECENFDMKDLDEREPCQTFPSHDFQSVGSESQQKTLKVPLTTRSTHSLALNNLKKQMTQDLNLTSPVQMEESSGSHHHSSQHLSVRQQTQPQVKYRNEHMKLQGPIQQPMQLTSTTNLNPEYLSGDGGSHYEPFSAESQKQNHSGPYHKANGSASTSDLGKKQSQNTQAIKDFFMEEQYVIKEEKHKSHTKQKAHNGGNSKQHKTKSGQLNMMARDFTMQNYAVIKNGSSTKVLNLPPKPSRNAKNNTLVLGSSQGAAQMRSVQSIMLGKVKNFNQQQTMQSTLVMTPKREQFSSNNLFKGYQHRSKAEKQSSQVGATAQQQPHHHQMQQQQQNAQLKNQSFKEAKGQLRYNNGGGGKNAGGGGDKHDRQNLLGSNGKARQSIGTRGSPHSKRIESAKKVSKVCSQDNLKNGAAISQHQYSLSMLQSSSTHNNAGGSSAVNHQKMPKTPHVQNFQNNTAEKKGAKHLYMSLTKERQSKNASTREKSISSDYQMQKMMHSHSMTSGPNRESHDPSQQHYLMAQQHRNNQSSNNDYEIVFDHLNEDSIPDHPSYDMEEQPTVVLIDDLQNQHQHQQQSVHHPHHKSKERNASLLNSSALSRDQQFAAHPFTKSVEPIPHSQRSNIKEGATATGRAAMDQLPKLGSNDSKLFRQSLGIAATTHLHTTPSNPGAKQNHSNNNSSTSGVMKDMHSYNKKQQQKIQQNNQTVQSAALKLKQSQAAAAAASASQQQLAMQIQSSSTGGGYSNQQNSQTVQSSRPLNKTQSLVSSQASLHQIGASSGKHNSKGGSNAEHSTHQRMLETYAKAMQGVVSQRAAGGGDSGQQPTSHSNKKTTKKSMIKQ